MSTSAFPASGRSDSLYDSSIGAVLKSLLDRYGIGLLGETGRLRGLLHDDCPQAKREVSVLLQALEERVPQDLMRVHSGEPIQGLAPRLAKRLSDEKGMSDHASRWAVDTWAAGLGLDALLPRTADSSAQTLRRDPANQADGGGTAVPMPVPVPRPNRTVQAVIAAVALCGVAAAAWFGYFQPVLEITRVETASTTFLGNGKPQAISLGISARHETVREVEARFVRGDGKWDPQTITTVVSGSPSGEAKIDAGALAYTTSQPMSATFEYTLVSTDGSRSKPFEHTFNIVAPVVITEAKAPRWITVGRPFNVAIKYQKGASDIVAIEQRVVDSTVQWPEAVTTTEVKLDQATGTYDYEYGAGSQPSRSTMEYVLVDAQGLRSDPARVVLEINNPAPAAVASRATYGGDAVMATVVSVQQVKTAGSSSGGGAVLGAVAGGVVGNQFGSGSGRGVMTALGAIAGGFAGNTVEQNVNSTTSWATVVRFDDGSVQTIHQGSRPNWAPGSQVMVNGGAIQSRR